MAESEGGPVELELELVELQPGVPPFIKHCATFTFLCFPFRDRESAQSSVSIVSYRRSRAALLVLCAPQMVVMKICLWCVCVCVCV